ncbi:DUF1566 domain-containing protein [Gammaproteobacteria bacterium PRO6]|nr:DUF1566 domain-containing protein [Gammaproteobacteria bacterium PRO6]
MPEASIKAASNGRSLSIVVPVMVGSGGCIPDRMSHRATCASPAQSPHAITCSTTLRRPVRAGHAGWSQQACMMARAGQARTLRHAAAFVAPASTVVREPRDDTPPRGTREPCQGRRDCQRRHASCVTRFAHAPVYRQGPAGFFSPWAAPVLAATSKSIRCRNDECCAVACSALPGMMRLTSPFWFDQLGTPDWRRHVAMMALSGSAFRTPLRSSRHVAMALSLGVAVVASSTALADDIIFQDGFDPPKVVKLNDTGIVGSADAGGGYGAICNPADPAGQDCDHGRDALAAAGQLPKIGGGNGGFDFTRVCNSGEKAGEGTCPANPVQGTGPDDWACTLDNYTGLLWELKTSGADLHSGQWTYTWYDSSAPGGAPGGDSGGTCFTAGRCDTEKFAQDVNVAGLCGFHDWRMPSVVELQGITDYGSAARIDVADFPSSPADYHFFWTATPYGKYGSNAYAILLGDGQIRSLSRSGDALAVRLVRDGQ